MAENIKIEIELNKETGQISVSGPMNDHILMLGLLEEARRMIHKTYSKFEDSKTEMKPAEPKPNIIIPRLHP